MITINVEKWGSFIFLIASSFIVAFAGYNFLEWDLEFGLLVGLILGAWNTLYDLGSYIAMQLNDDEEMEELDEEI